jgi:hypothetical protein
MNNYNIELIGGFDNVNSVDDNADLYVQFENGDNYVVTVYTPQNIITILLRYQDSGECLFGKYYYDTNMLLVDSIDFDSIKKVIDDLIRNDEFNTVFKKANRI